jgi:two-component system sensor histidine kinase KdpD
VTWRRGWLASWLLWCGMLFLATMVLVANRASIDQSHAVLTLLLVVLGGSAMGGRPLGGFLACAGFGLIDYYFQPPFDELSVTKPLDMVILVAFFATAAVTTELLARARQEAAAAQARTDEVASLSVLAAATLRYARPSDALDAIAPLIQETIGAGTTEIVPLAPDGRLHSASTLAPDERDAAEAAVRASAVILEREGARPHVFDLERTPSRAPLVVPLLALPLSAEGRVIGVLIMRGNPTLSLNAARRRFVRALTYYAALALERQRLVTEASHSEALREANRAKDEVLAAVSHDLRTPLTTIKVLAQDAESRGDPSASAIVEQADRLARMVGDLLELSRLRAGGLAPSADLNTAEDVVGAALRRAAGVLNGRTIAPHIDLESPALVGTFDFVQTLRILGNLLDNALRHTARGGVVDLTVTRDGPCLSFTVADRGTGVHPGERGRIFSAFYRPEGALPDTGHAGLGLSIARMLAELQHGTLEYADREGGGSEFRLRLPAADTSDQSADIE